MESDKSEPQEKQEQTRREASSRNPTRGHQETQNAGDQRGRRSSGNRRSRGCGSKPADRTETAHEKDHPAETGKKNVKSNKDGRTRQEERLGESDDVANPEPHSKQYKGSKGRGSQQTDRTETAHEKDHPAETRKKNMKSNRDGRRRQDDESISESGNFANPAPHSKQYKGDTGRGARHIQSQKVVSNESGKGQSKSDDGSRRRQRDETDTANKYSEPRSKEYESRRSGGHGHKAQDEGACQSNAMGAKSKQKERKKSGKQIGSGKQDGRSSPCKEQDGKTEFDPSQVGGWQPTRTKPVGLKTVDKGRETEENKGIDKARPQEAATGSGELQDIKAGQERPEGASGNSGNHLFGKQDVRSDFGSSPYIPPRVGRHAGAGNYGGQHSQQQSYAQPKQGRSNYQRDWNYNRGDRWCEFGPGYAMGASYYGTSGETNNAYGYDHRYGYYDQYHQYLGHNVFPQPQNQFSSWNYGVPNSDQPYYYDYGVANAGSKRSGGHPKQSAKTRPPNRQMFRGKKGKQHGRHPDGTSTVQASALADQLRNSSYECMVCCETIGFTTAVWSCSSCYHIFHLRCIKRWATSPAALVQGESEGWRCPACQNVEGKVPNRYKCFCGKVTDPVWNPRDGLTPHSCGELCHKKRDPALECVHPCTQLCHPGPCPSCPVMLKKDCSCGKKKIQVRCGQSAVVLCDMVCGKLLNCQQHRCKAICHTGMCAPCEVKVEQCCYCGKKTRETFCGTGEPDCVSSSSTGCFSCDDTCGRTLDCGNHSCQRPCHRGGCDACELKPAVVTHCPCGKSSVAELLGEGRERQSCLEPVPLCGQPCNKLLPCSPATEADDAEHRCSKQCHLGPCGTCDKARVLKCRCGATHKEIPCAEITSEAPLCEQRCNKKRHCGRHRCNQKCCVDTVHLCELICGKKLRCKLHKCEELCHPGYCPPCLLSGFDELTCHCGASVLFPPIPCGTPPPACDLPCSREHACPHPVHHLCHSEETCPPCTVLTKKMCMGEHEMRLNIPCHLTDVSCGKPCGNSLLSCGHKCTRTCHKGPCLEEGQACSQTCTEPRKECDHPCDAPCHAGRACPAQPCTRTVIISCKCGRRTDSVPCLHGDKAALTQAYQRLTTETLATRIKELQLGQSVEIATIMKCDENKSRKIECNDECATVERNRRVAEALNITNPNLSPHSPPPYSPFLLSEARHNLSFIKSVEENLAELVRVTLKSSAPQRTHSFPSMNANHRRIVHEMALLYNCSSRSYDLEPKRNTIVTATKESRIPSASLAAQTERELNPPAPPPVPFLPSEPKERRPRQMEDADKIPKTWNQAPDYFADDFRD